MAIPEKRADFKPANRLRSPLPEPSDAKPPDKSHRLEVPLHPQYEPRSHQPNIDALIEPQMANPDFLEHDWDGRASSSWRLPLGWLVLLALLLAAGGVWTFFQLKPKPVRENTVLAEQVSTRSSEAQEEREAEELLARIERVTREYYAATTVDELVKHTRHPDHVRPLMERHYQGQKIQARGPVKRVSLHPMTVNRHANFWYQDVRFSDRKQRQMVIEVVNGNQPKIDWESEACYQPMPWDRFATERPAKTSLDFRVFVSPDTFYSHEFTEAGGWRCFLLATNDSKETLFGYAREDSEVAKVLRAHFRANPGKRYSVILKLSVPADVQSKRGVVIEKLVNSIWLYVDPPKSDK